MSTPIINEIDMTAPRVKAILDYTTYSVELYYDNEILVECVITAKVDETDPEYVPSNRFANLDPSLRKIIDAVYDYQTSKNKPASITV